MTNIKVEKKQRRHKKIRSKISGTEQKPRVSVCKSNTGIFVQFVDDKSAKTLLSGSTKKVDGKTKTEKSKNLGLALGKEAMDKKITEVVFDRGGNLYTGRVQAIADGLREAGLKF
ncbi:50S ribosomal protein L18 [Candidatus Campbellbacteria bacterium]|nr:MAG: 50S ribosomal protein L18 [Candidatus Campbellbacteria bacterium]